MSEALWKSIGGIGDDLISEADEKNVREHFSGKGRRIIRRCSSLAACLVLVCALGIAANNIIGNMFSCGSGDKKSPESENSAGGEKHNAEYPSYSLSSAISDYYTEDNKIYFVLEITGNTEIDCIIRGYRFSPASGSLSEVNKEELVAHCSGASIPDDDQVLIEDALKITVNGKEESALPCVPGLYEIIIDYSEFAKLCDGIYDTVEITGFGNFPLSQEKGKEK